MNKWLPLDRCEKGYEEISPFFNRLGEMKNADRMPTPKTKPLGFDSNKIPSQVFELI